MKYGACHWKLFGSKILHVTLAILLTLLSVSKQNIIYLSLKYNLAILGFSISYWAEFPLQSICLCTQQNITTLLHLGHFLYNTRNFQKHWSKSALCWLHIRLCLAKELLSPSTANQPWKHTTGKRRKSDSWWSSIITGNWCNFMHLEGWHISCGLTCLTQRQKIRRMKKQPSLPPDSAMLLSKSLQPISYPLFWGKFWGC